MEKVYWLCFVLFWTLVKYSNSSEPVKYPEDSDETSFHFDLQVEPRMTMAVLSEDKQSLDIVYYNPDTEKYFIRNVSMDADCNAQTELSPDKIAEAEDKGGFLFGDGRHKIVLTVNGSLPGPTLVVNQGATIHLVLHGQSHGGISSLHSHGLINDHNWYMNGVAGLQQCPIPAGSSFTYSLKADSPGTHFYHSFFSSSGMLYGALIVLPEGTNGESESYNISGSAIKPTSEFVVLLREDFESNAQESMFGSHWSLMKLYPTIDSETSYTGPNTCLMPSRTYDGGRNAPDKFKSVWVNNHGWYRLTDVRTKSGKLKMEEYEVEVNKSYLFRIINAGWSLKYMVSIDKHKMMVVASDGGKFQPVEVNYLIIAPGERYDVLVTADQAPNVYYMRFDTMEVLDYNKVTKESNLGLARIKYKSFTAPKPSLPFDSGQQCTADNKCKVLNCFFKEFKQSLNYECVHLQNLHGLTELDTDVLKNGFDENDDRFQEIFLNVQYPNRINGMKFMYPLAPPYFYDGHDDEKIMKKCDDTCEHDGGAGCACTWYLNITEDNIVQMVFFNPTGNVDTLDSYAHPMHVHGHHFYIVKQGWGTYDAATGLLTEASQDLSCDSEKKCAMIKEWASNDFKHGKLPEANFDHPIVKDTVIVPIGGYVVVRFKAENPGWWPIHSQSMPHHLGGVAVAMKVGEKGDMPAPPKILPTCGYFNSSMNNAGVGTVIVTSFNFFIYFLAAYFVMLFVW